MRSLRGLVPASIVALAPATTGLAQAQAQSQQAPSATAAPAQTAPAQGAPAQAGAAQPGASPDASAGGPQAAPGAPKVPATGYGYGDTPAPRKTGGAPRHRRIAHAPGPVATLPGFEMLADGGSRLFVQLTQNVPVEEKRAGNTVTYVLKGAHVEKYNNERPLVTVHFNTPVQRARLMPAGRDLRFVVELRKGAQPTWKIEAAKDGGAILSIDFPKGDYVPSRPAAPPADASGGDAEGDDAQDAPPSKPAN